MKKRVVIPVLMSSLLAFGTTVSAATDEVNAGITPDQFFYSLDQVLEKLQLLVTVNDEKEVELLLKIANERLAEAKEMNTEENEKFINEIIDDYINKLESVEEKLSELLLSEELEEDVMNDLQDEVQKVTEVDEEIEDKLEDETKEELDETSEVIKELPAVVNGLSKDQVAELREQDLGYGQIAQVFILADKSGKSIEEIASLFSGESKGFGDVAKELGFHPSEIAKGKDSEKSHTEEKLPDEEREEDTETENEEGEIGSEEETPVTGVSENKVMKEKKKEKQVKSKQEEERKREEAKKEEERKREEAKKEEERKREEAEKEEERKREEAEKEEKRKREEAKEKEDKENKNRGNGNNP